MKPPSRKMLDNVGQQKLQTRIYHQIWDLITRHLLSLSWRLLKVDMFARFQVQFACFTSLIKAFGKKMIRNPWNNRDDTVRDVQSATLKRMVLADVHIQLRWRWRKISEAHGKLYSPHLPANRSTPHETSWNCRQDPIQPPSMPSLKQPATLPRTFWWSPTPPALPSSLRLRKLQGNPTLVENTVGPPDPFD